MTEEAPQPQEGDAPLNREERRALKHGKKAGAKSKQPMNTKKAKGRSQMPGGGPGKFQLPTKNG